MGGKKQKGKELSLWCCLQRSWGSFQKFYLLAAAYLRAPLSVNPLRNIESQQYTARAVLQHFVKTSLNIRNSLLMDN